MTENEIKEMYKSIANGDKWECKCNGNNTCSQCEIGTCLDETWRPFKLGEAIHENFEYRKVEKWCVTTMKEIIKLDLLKSYDTPIFVGSKEDCEEWKKEHTKTWLEENYPIENFSLYSDICLNEYKRDAIEEVCQKIFEEIENRKSENTNNFYCYMHDELLKILRDLGVKL